jgi:hypothetical protein
MATSFGGPIMAQTVPTETAAQRYNRDYQQRGGDVKYTEGVGLAGATATTVAATATGGRTDRELLQQTAERQDRLYVDRATGISAVTGTKDEDFDDLAAGDDPIAVAAEIAENEV